MGVGGRGGALLQGFAKRPDVAVAYLADVDSRRLPERASEAAQLNGRRRKPFRTSATCSTTRPSMPS